MAKFLFGLQFEEQLPPAVREELLQMVAALQKAFAAISTEIPAALDNTPIGTVIMRASSDTPSGYLPCDGAAVSRTEYLELFTEIGTTFGVGDGSTTFNVPNCQCVSPIGAGSRGGYTTRNMGVLVGSETHTLVTNEIPVHNHPFTTRSTGGTTKISVQNSQRDATSETVNEGGVGNTGGGAAHNNMQPSLPFAFFIKY